MITRVSFTNFKGFSSYDVNLGRLNLLVGGNNSGKTSVFHALQLIFWCIERTVDISATDATFRKTQVAQVGVVPYVEVRDLFYRQQVQGSRKTIKIELEIEAEGIPVLRFAIYRAFSRNLMIDGANQRMSRTQYDRLIEMKPVYISGAVGITVQEEYLRAVSQQRLIAEGRQNQVLRNLVYRLKLSQDWDAFRELVQPLFSLQGLDVPFDVDKDEWLTATYAEDGCQFDLVSAGSGFLQTINLLCFLFLNESKTALLDEPDSHMHDDLQRLVFQALNELSSRKKLQLIVATHSPTMIDSAGLESVRLIDRKQKHPLVAQSVETLLPLLADQGLSPPPNKVLETLRVRRALFVEGMESDYNAFVAAAGEVCFPGFGARTRGLNVFETGGASKKWPFDAIDCFERLLGAKLDFVYLSDRDLLTDDEVASRENEGAPRKIVHLSRRHRESYLLDPDVLARVLMQRWKKNPRGAVPSDLRVEGLRQWMLERAKALEDETRTDLLVEHEASLRGDARHRATGTSRLNEYFRKAYVEPLSRKEIPYKLLNAKLVLRNLRSHIASNYQISFADVDVIKAWRPDEVPADIKKVAELILTMFGGPPKPVTSAADTASSPSPAAAGHRTPTTTGPKRSRSPASKAPPAVTRPKSKSNETKARTTKPGKPAKRTGTRRARPKSELSGGTGRRAASTRRVVSRRAARSASGTTTDGSTGPALQDVALNRKELMILRVLGSARGPLALAEIASRAFGDEVRGNSWVRNSVRRPVGNGWVRKVGSGVYECTSLGREMLRDMDR